jgi:hypothetical protein
MHPRHHVPVVVPKGGEGADEPPQVVGRQSDDVGGLVAVAAQQLVDRQIELVGQLPQPGLGHEGRQQLVLVDSDELPDFVVDGKPRRDPEL